MVAATSATFGHLAKSALGIAWRLGGVSMIDGSTAFTQIRSAASSSERLSVRLAKAALLAAYADRPAVGISAGLAATLTIRPPGEPGALRILRTASRQQRKLVTAFVSNILRKSASEVSVIAPGAKPPAACTDPHKTGID